MDFSARISDAQVNLEKDGFKTALWTPEWDIPANEKEAFASPHDPQLLAALQVFAWLFVSSIKRVWVHLGAEMQAGKTGVIATVARLVLSNARTLGFAPNRIFVVTGMSDEAWQNQTDPRLPAILRENVHHGGTLSQVASKLKSLAAGGRLSNVLIFIDESHYATSSTNQPARHIYDVVALSCPRQFWTENNIRFVTISATDPAKAIAMKASEMSCRVVPLLTTKDYQSVEKLQTAGRIQFLEQIPENGCLHSDTGLTAMAKAVRDIEAVHGPLVHILRPNHGKGGLVAERIRTLFPDAVVHQWDVASNKERRAKDDGSSGIGSATDINIALLNDAPETTTFVLLKGMFRAAKTLNDKHVGVLYDRVGAGDATNLQSLLGRACGYGKSTRTVVFTSRSTVDNYLRLWRELCASMDTSTEGDVANFSNLRGRMPGVATVSSATRDTAKLVTTAGHASPLGAGVGVATAEEIAAGARTSYVDDDYKVVWSQEFSSIEDLKSARITAGKMPTPDADGFYKNANGGKGPMSRAQLMALKGGKKTTNMRLPLENVGDITKRTYPFYESISDKTTLRFVVRTLERIR
jgi:hypothetical protein